MRVRSALLMPMLLVGLTVAACRMGGPARVEPLPPGTQDCIGLDEALCAEVLKGYTAGDVGPDGPAAARTPVAWRIRCTAVCDTSRGETEVTITWSDGNTNTSTMGWVGELVVPDGPGAPGGPGVGPMPTPAVAPTCTGVPREECEEQWRTSLVNLSEEQWEQLVAVEVRCSGVCTLIVGSGTTTLVLDDGTRVAGVDWSYDYRP